MKMVRWAVVVIGVFGPLPGLGQPRIDCPPAAAGVQREESVIYSEELKHKHRQSREADLARLKATFERARAVRTGSAEEPKPGR